MAEEKKTPEKQGWFKKLINWFKNLPGRIAKAFKNMVAELRKVTWPSKKKLINSSIIVLVFMLVIGAIVALLDLGSAAAVEGLYRIKNGDEVDAQVAEEYAAYYEAYLSLYGLTADDLAAYDLTAEEFMTGNVSEEKLPNLYKAMLELSYGLTAADVEAHGVTVEDFVTGNVSEEVYNAIMGVDETVTDETVADETVTDETVTDETVTDETAE